MCDVYNASDNAAWGVVLTPNEQECREGLRVALPTKKFGVAVKATVLGLAAVWCFVAFFAQKDPASLAIGIAAVVLLGLVIAAPTVRRNTLARQAAAGDGVRLWVFADGVAFGAECPERAAYPFGSFASTRGDGVLAWRFDRDEVVVVPLRQLTAEQTEQLIAATGSPDAGRQE